jgi:hypothetical protein
MSWGKTDPPTRSHLGMKRAREYDGYEEHPKKVRRVRSKDRLTGLSEELLVRILSYTPVHTLLVCQL